MAATGRTLESLKVSELKIELEARGCDSSGLKSVLVTKLKDALKSNGDDPDTYVFDRPGTPNNAAKPQASEDTPRTSNSSTKNDTKSGVSDTSSTKGSTVDSSKNVDEDSNLIVHVGDTFDLDYDLAGKRLEEDTKGKNDDSTSDPKKSIGDGKAESKNLWVSNIKDVKAAELRSHFSTVGKVLAARVFVNRTPRAQSKYYGFVQMASVEAADRCVKELNRSLINGQRIYVDKAKREVPVAATKRPLPATFSGGVAAKKSAPSATAKEGEKKDVKTVKSSATAAAATAITATAATSNKSASSTKSIKSESKKENSSASDRKSDSISAAEREKLEIVKKKEEDLERLKQRQLKLAKTQQLEFDRLAREKEKLRYEREEIERERRNLRKIRKEVESSSETVSEGHHHSRQSWKDTRERHDHSKEQASGSHARYFSTPKPFYRPSATAASSSDRSSRYYDSDPRTSRSDREGDNSYRRYDDNRYSGGSSSYMNSISRDDSSASGQRYSDSFGSGETSRSRATPRYGYDQSASRPNRSYEQSSSSSYKRDQTNDYGSQNEYTRDYGSYFRQQPNTSSSYSKNYSSDKNYSIRDRSPQRSTTERYAGSSSTFARHNPYYSASSGAGLDRGMGTSHRPSVPAMTPTFLGGSSSALGSSGTNGPSSSSPMFLGGGGSSASTFPPSGSYYGAAAVTSLAASALANSAAAAASSMRYDAYTAAAAASGRNVGGSVYHHSSRH